MVVFIKLFGNRCRVLDFGSIQECTGNELKQYILENECLPGELEDHVFLCHNGRTLNEDSRIQLDNGDSLVSCHFKLLGGKGGFGSMLRAIGAQIEKTTNREACRDLSGRRMRDVNDEKKIADWLSKQSEREQEKARVKQERLERLKSSPRHVFQDSTQYTSQLQDNLDSIEDALQKAKGVKSSQPSTSTLGKRKTDEKAKRKSKKQKLWLGVDEDLSSDSDDDSDVGSSCSSVTSNNSYVMGSEASSLASGHTSESEHTDNQPSSSDLAEEISSSSACSTEITSSTVNSTDILSQSSPVTSTTCSKQSIFVENCDKKMNTIVQQADDGSKQCNETTSSVAQTPESKALSPNTTDNISSSEAETVDLDKCQSSEELENLGLDVLKSCLMARGLKCGGTLQQRAERLFSVKGIPQDKIDPSLLAKPSGRKQRKGT